MVSNSRNAFHHLVLRPLACITAGCRPKSTQDVKNTKDLLKRATGGPVDPNPTPQKHLHSELIPLEVKKHVSFSFSQEAVEQSQCPLLSKVPTEVRVMIYYYVMCISVPLVHIVRRTDGSLSHVRCRATRGECGIYRCFNDYSDMSRSTKARSKPTSDQVGTSVGFLALPLTCKKMLVPLPLIAISTCHNSGTATQKPLTRSMPQTHSASSIFLSSTTSLPQSHSHV